MEQVLRGLQNFLIYINDVLINTDTHKKHLRGPGTSSDEVTSAPPKNQYGQMSILRPTSLLPRIHFNSRRNQTRRSQAESNQECETTQ